MLRSVCQQIWKTQQWPQDWKRSVFIPIPKKGNAKECSNYCTIALISHINKGMLKILQASLQLYMNQELLDVQAGFRKGRGTKDQIANIHWIIEKAREFQKNIYLCFIDYTKAFDCVDHNKLWNILKEMGIPDHLTCLLRNLYAGQEATVRTGHGTIDWFQIGKGIHQGCILSPCLFNLYAGSVQLSSVAQSCPTLYDPMNLSTPGLPVHHQLLEFTQTHFHWVSVAIQPSHPLLSPSSPALNLSQHQGLFKWVSSSHQVAGVLEFQVQHQSHQWTPRTDLL